MFCLSFTGSGNSFLTVSILLDGGMISLALDSENFPFAIHALQHHGHVDSIKRRGRRLILSWIDGGSLRLVRETLHLEFSESCLRGDVVCIKIMRNSWIVCFFNCLDQPLRRIKFFLDRAIQRLDSSSNDRRRYVEGRMWCDFFYIITNDEHSKKCYSFI